MIIRFELEKGKYTMKIFNFKEKYNLLQNFSSSCYIERKISQFRSVFQTSDYGGFNNTNINNLYF